MVYRLDTSTVLGHLIHRGLCDSTDRLLSVASLSSKNLNLLVTLSRSMDQASPVTTRYLVKQSPFKEVGTSGDGFRQEWKLYQWIRSHQELSSLWAWLPDPVDHDPHSGVLVFRFLDHYLDLGKAYARTRVFPTNLAAALGASVAAVHQATFRREGAFTSIDPNRNGNDNGNGNGAGHASGVDQPPDLCGELEDLTPDIFRKVPRDGLKFYILYQRAPEISDAILALENSYQACCVIHHDLKLANVLLHRQWSEWRPPYWPAQPADLVLQGNEGIVRLIDWEQWRWGDPAYDLGALVAEYLRLWLKSSPISKDLDPATALQLAAIPLEALQPSMRNLIAAYVAQFPSILSQFPDFSERVLRFAGLGLLKAIQDRLHYKEPFGNLEISMMQVGRTLLCHPEAALSTIIGGTDRQSTVPEDCRDPGCGEDRSRLPLQAAPPCVPETATTVRSKAIPMSLWPPQGTWPALIEELCAHVRLEPEVIQHSAYPPLGLSHPGRCKRDQDSADRVSDDQDSAERKGIITPPMEAAYRLRQVRKYLHAIYFSGELNQRSDPPSPGDAFTRQLEAANSGIGYIDAGWIVIREVDGDLLVAKDGLHLWVDPTYDVVMQADHPNASHPASESCPSTGALVALRLPNATWIDGDYVAIGDAGEPEPASPTIELYFNIIAEGSIWLMKSSLPMLNHRGCPFSLRIHSDPQGFERRNGVVLRLPATEYGQIRSLLMAIYPELHHHLRSPIPLFTFPLAPGIGLAEVPDNGTAFGVDRCDLLAEALVAAPPDGPYRQQGIQELFGQRGLDWHRPHLNPGSKRDYPPVDRRVMPIPTR